MDPPEGQTYKFSPLPTKTSIRLLQIHSGPEEPINCSLEVVDLDDKPEYDCLSYTWGNPLYHGVLPPKNGREINADRIHPIECNGLIICVAKNLHEALRQLSRNGLSSTSGPHQYQRQSRIWIDAICINQEVVSEQGAQVAMMKRIYGQAQNVVIWLGPDDLLTELGIRVMMRLARVLPQKREIELPDDLEDPEVYSVLDIPVCDSQDWLALGTFLLRTWFGRVWVLQESFFARNVVVFCGTHVLDWEDITAAAKTLGDTGLGRLLMEHVEEVRDTGMKVAKYVGNTINNVYIVGEMKEDATSLTLEMLLQQSRYFGATDKRDHVYAVLGMCTHHTASDSIKTDYSLSIRDVYAKASLVSIRQMGDLNLLSLVEDSSLRSEEMELEENLPSWVPDYTVTPVAEPLRGNPRPEEGAERWQASKGLKWEEPEEQHLPLLSVQGIHVTTITKRAATEAEIMDEHQEHTLLEILQDCLEAPSTPYKDGPIDAFWRTLIKDTFRGEPAGDEARQAFATLIIVWVWRLEVLIADLKRLAATTSSSQNPDPDPKNLTRPPYKPFTDAYSLIHSLLLALSPKDKNHILPSWTEIQSTIALTTQHLPETFDPDHEHISESFRLAYRGRRLFLTGDKYLGIGPESLEVGDQVWVLAGAQVPLVLRSTGSRWRLVGEAYVCGVMDGEAVTKGGAVRIFIE
jgi:hypothetical protein